MMQQLVAHSMFYGIFRWIHLVAVVAVIGPSLVMRYVVLPSAAELDEKPREDFLKRAGRRLLAIVPVAALFLIVSGIVNLVRAVTVAPAPPPSYMILFSIKFILAIVVFVIAGGLAATTRPPNLFNRNPARWHAMVVHLGLVVMALGVALRFMSGK